MGRLGTNWGGPGRDRGPSGRYEMGQWTFGKVRDGSVDPWGGSGRVGEVRVGSGDPREGLGRVEE